MQIYRGWEIKIEGGVWVATSPTKVVKLAHYNTDEAAMNAVDEYLKAHGR